MKARILVRGLVFMATLAVLGFVLRELAPGSLLDTAWIDADVRGKGFMIGCEIQTEGMPDGDRADRIVKVCEAHGLLLLRCGPKKNVVRWLPPLIATRQQIDEGVDIFAKALDATV